MPVGARGATSASAFNLALFRISLSAMVLLSPEIRTAAAWAQLPRSLFVVPEGLGWFVAHVPITPTIARVASYLFVAGALCALAGWRTRLALAVVTGAGFYILALPQLSGSVNHNMHFLWFSALLAASPSGDAWSIDAWRAGRGWKSPEGPQYAWPIDVACLLFGAIYFFPGFWKLATSGLDWIWSDNLRNHMYWKWFESGWTPAFRIDRHPLLCRLGAAAVVAFELTFPCLVLRRSLRPIAAVGGVAFHLATEWIVRIPFFGLWGLYLVLLDGRRIAN
ncbi:MAG TPA: HTTM domain-containing protein, partial [Polyangia bacterium]